MNPFTEIEVTNLFSKDGMRSNGKSVRIQDDSEWKEIGVVSQNYLLVHNEKVKQVVDDIAQLSNIDDWQQRKLFFDGKRFVYSITTENITAEITKGDLVRFGLIGYNSYDGSRALSVGMYAEHLVCSNGMTSETYFSRFTFKHHKGNINWDENVEEAFRTLMPGSRARLVRFANTLNKLKSKTITTDDLKELRSDYLSDYSPANWGRVIDSFLQNKDFSGFGFLDACTRIFWHNEKQTFSDYRNNTYATDKLIEYSQTIL